MGLYQIHGNYDFWSVIIDVSDISIWCCKMESAKHRESKLVLISYDHAWAAFKSHTVALEDQRMRYRINCLINSAADQPYALEIRYHLKCWLKYVRIHI